MLSKLTTLLLIGASAMPLFLGAETGIRNLTPRGTDATSARACGADLETVKKAKGFTHRVVLHEGDILKNMQFCKDGKLYVSTSEYRIVVPAGEEIVAWTDDDGAFGVIEGCINQFEFENPVPPETPPTFTFVPPHPVVPNLPNFGVPPWRPVGPPPPPRPPYYPPEKCECVAIMSTYALSELQPNSPPVEIWAVVADGELADGAWYVDGQVFMTGLRIKLEPMQLYNFVKGKPGVHTLSFAGHDTKGNIIACGTGVSLTLMKKGRRWWWKLPLTHCVYTFTHDMKKWKHGPLAEKAVCAVEVGVIAWWLAPEEAAVILAKPPTPVFTLLP